jgi:hypothetical protein
MNCLKSKNEAAFAERSFCPELLRSLQNQQLDVRRRIVLVKDPLGRDAKFIRLGERNLGRGLCCGLERYSLDAIFAT